MQRNTRHAHLPTPGTSEDARTFTRVHAHTKHMVKTRQRTSIPAMSQQGDDAVATSPLDVLRSGAGSWSAVQRRKTNLNAADSPCSAGLLAQLLPAQDLRMPSSFMSFIRGPVLQPNGSDTRQTRKTPRYGHPTCSVGCFRATNGCSMTPTSERRVSRPRGGQENQTYAVCDVRARW